MEQPLNLNLSVYQSTARAQAGSRPADAPAPATAPRPGRREHAGADSLAAQEAQHPPAQLPSRPAPLLTPAVERVLEWHQHRVRLS